MGREVQPQLQPQRSQQQEVSYTVEQLVAFNHYNPDILPDLENYVNEQTGRFHQFWDEAAKSRHLLEAVPGFEQAIQAYAVHVLSLTYQNVLRAVLAEAINVEGPSLDKFIEHQVTKYGWAIDKGQLSIISQNEFNHPELKKSDAETVPLEHIT